MTSAREATNRLADLLRREHNALAEFLVALAAFDRERRWVDLGHRSLFYFLHRELGLPKGPAFYRKTAAELIQRYPEIAGALRDGRLNLTSIVELAKVITPENQAKVLPRFFHTSKQEAKEVAAAIAPADAPPLRTVVTVVRPAVIAADGCLAGPAGAAVAATACSLPGTEALAPSLVLPDEPLRANPGSPEIAAGSDPAGRARPPAIQVEPLTADLRRIHVTVSRRLLDKLAAARDALSHSHPGASEDEIFEVGLDLILQRQAKRRGLTTRAPKAPEPSAATAATVRAPSAPGTHWSNAAPGTAASANLSATPTPAMPPPSPSERSRYVRAHVRRAVWKRDNGCCQWSVESGGICGATYQVEMDHIHGWALGADTTVEELRLLCRVHQDVHARRLYGDALMNNYTRPKGGVFSEPVAEYAANRGPSSCDARAAAAELPREPAGPVRAARSRCRAVNDQGRSMAFHPERPQRRPCGPDHGATPPARGTGSAGASRSMPTRPKPPVGCATPEPRGGVRRAERHCVHVQVQLQDQVEAARYLTPK